MKLQFGTARPGLDYIHRPAVFGIAERDGRLACVRVGACHLVAGVDVVFGEDVDTLPSVGGVGWRASVDD